MSLFSSSVLRDRQQYTVKQQGVLYISAEYVRNLITDWRISDKSKKKAGSISSSVKCHTSLILSEHTTVLFVCMSETPTEMAVMLSKIFILLPGYSSETRSYLADIETVKEGETERKRERKRKRESGWWRRGPASIIEVPGCYQFIQGQYGRFQFVLVSRQRFPVLGSRSLYSRPFYLFSLSRLLIHSQL